MKRPARETIADDDGCDHGIDPCIRWMSVRVDDFPSCFQASQWRVPAPEHDLTAIPRFLIILWLLARLDGWARRNRKRQGRSGLA
jgi:hypothetical protein